VSSTIAPGFLVATPSLGCPFFNHTLVLMIEHAEEGSFGFVVNKPSELPLREVLEQVGVGWPPGDAPEDASLAAPVLRGGPVSPETGWIVFEPNEATSAIEEQVEVHEGVGLTASTDMLHAIAEGRGPKRFLMFLGYSGWGPGQLEDEMRQGAWIPVDLDPALLFEVGFENRWETALREMGIDPGRVSQGSKASA